MADIHDRKGDTYSALFKHFVSTCTSTSKGKLLLTLWGGGGAITILWGIYQKVLSANRARGKKENPRSGDHSEKNSQDRNPFPTARKGLVAQLKQILPMAFPSMWSHSTGYLTVYTIFLVARILLTIKIAKVTGRLGKMIGAGTFTKMFHLQVVFSLWCFPAAVVNSLLSYCSDKLSLAMRNELVQNIHNKYFGGLVFYRASNIGRNRMEDVDQRATQDLKKFCSSASELYGNLLKPVLELVLLSHTLSKLMGFEHLMGFYLYFMISGQWLRFVMPPFAKLHADAQKLEGDFRTNHTRITSHAEEIAFYGGSEREKQIANASYSNIVKLADKHYFLQLVMGIFDSYLVKYGASMVAYSMLIPAVYLGKQGLKGKSTSEIMEYYLTATQLFVALGAACKHLVLSYKRIQALTGLTVRVSEMLDMLKQRLSYQDEKDMKEMALKHPLRTGGEPTIIQGDDIRFENVDIFSPSGQLLIRNLNFQVSKNVNVLISGRNGSGKSSLFRVLGGLWPLCSGTLIRPNQTKLFYVPQKPYMSPGTLRDQITYPLHLEGEQDAKLRELLELVELGYLVDRESWDSVKDWADVLSGGEKQRVAMARLFFHKPDFGILDECTSAVSVDVEAKIYETCKNLGITIFTVSHRPQLMHHHDYMLRLDGEGGWEWKAIEKTPPKN